MSITRIPITIKTMDELHFAVHAPCGGSWAGMTMSDDLQIQVRKAIKHAESCADCAKFSDYARG